MEIAFLPSKILKLLTKNNYKQHNLNILISNLSILLILLFLSNSLILVADSIPHFCLFKYLTKINCPACGITRGLNEISVGNIHKAYTLNPVSFFIVFFMISQVFLRFFIIIHLKSRIKLETISKKANYLILASLLLNWTIQLFNH